MGSQSSMTEPIGESIKSLMRSFPQGVTIVTGVADGSPFGVTVSAFSSVSLEPPLVMVSMSKGTRARDMLSTASAFTINVLSADQSDIAERFAGRSDSHRYRFEGINTRVGSNGCPIFSSAVGYLECSGWSQHEEGDHTMIVGRVTEAGLNGDSPPLVYYKRRYTTVVTPAADSEAHDSLLAEW